MATINLVGKTTLPPGPFVALLEGLETQNKTFQE